MRYQVRCCASEIETVYQVIDTHIPGDIPIANEFLTKTAAQESARQLNEVWQEVTNERRAA